MPTSDAPPAELLETDNIKLKAHLAELLQDESFLHSQRSRQFLTYIVGEVLAGRGEQIKERNIAVEVFGKGQDFDSQVESIVRVKAVEVRKRLLQAYTRIPAHPIRIALPVGTYQPIIHLARLDPRAVDGVIPVETQRRGALHTKSIWIWALLAAFGGVALAVCIRPRPGLSDQLWAPFVKQNRPVLISLPAPAVIGLSQIDLKGEHAGVADLLSSKLRSTEGHYVGVGAAAGAARFGEQLALRGHSFILKYGSDVSFADLRHGPAILLGALTSRWTVEMTRNLPLRFDETTSGKIIDATDSTRAWTESHEISNRPRSGLALVSRLLKSESGNVLLIVAGVNSLDTQSAVDFLTNEQFFREFAHYAPDWTTKNFEVLLRTTIHDRTPGAPTVILVKCW